MWDINRDSFYLCSPSSRPTSHLRCGQVEVNSVTRKQWRRHAQRLCSSAYGALQICFMIMIMWKTQHLWDLTESDDVERLAEADTDETELCGIVIAIPDQQLSVGLNRQHRPVVDVSCRLDCGHVLAVHAAGTVDKSQPVWSMRIPTIHKVR